MGREQDVAAAGNRATRVVGEDHRDVAGHRRGGDPHPPEGRRPGEVIVGRVVAQGRRPRQRVDADLDLGIARPQHDRLAIGEGQRRPQAVPGRNRRAGIDHGVDQRVAGRIFDHQIAENLAADVEQLEQQVGVRRQAEGGVDRVVHHQDRHLAERRAAEW